MGLPGELVALISENLDFDSWLALAKVDDSFIEWVMNPVRLRSVIARPGFIVKPGGSNPVGREAHSWFSVPSTTDIKEIAMNEQKRRQGNKERVLSLLNIISLHQQGIEHGKKLKRVIISFLLSEFTNWNSNRDLETRIDRIRTRIIPRERHLKMNRWIHCGCCNCYFLYPRPQILYNLQGAEYCVDIEGHNLITLLGTELGSGMEENWSLLRVMRGIRSARGRRNSTFEALTGGRACIHSRSFSLKRLQDEKAILKRGDKSRRVPSRFLEIVYIDTEFNELCEIGDIGLPDLAQAVETRLEAYM